jgi:hypothetical protein
MAESVTLKSIAFDMEHPAIGGDVHLVRAAIGAALELEEAGGAPLLEVGLLQDKARDLGLGGGEDICGDFVFRDVVVEVIAGTGIARCDGLWLGGTGGEKGRRGCGKQ